MDYVCPTYESLAGMHTHVKDTRISISPDTVPRPDDTERSRSHCERK